MSDIWKQVAGELNTLLAPLGFRRSGLRFVNKRNPEVVRTITAEKFRWNTPGDNRFQLAMAIYLATGDTGEFTFAGCAGRYSGVGGEYSLRDKPLHRAPESVPSEAFRERLRTDLERRVLAFLQSCDSLDATIRALDADGGSVQLAIALARLGRINESRRFLLREQGNPMVHQIAAQYGIKL